MQINNIQLDFGEDIYYDGGFRIDLEDHMTYLRTHPSTTKVIVDPVYSYKYVGDLSSLLLQYNVPVYLHWVIMRVNNFTSFADATDKLTTLLIPDTTEIERIRRSYQTQHKAYI